MLERMYHKRLKGYAELGYQVKFGTSDEPVSMIYDGHAAMAAFEQDLSDAAQSIVIVSPYLQKGRVGRLLPLLQIGTEALYSIIVISVYTIARMHGRDNLKTFYFISAVPVLLAYGSFVCRNFVISNGMAGAASVLLTALCAPLFFPPAGI